MFVFYLDLFCQQVLIVGSWCDVVDGMMFVVSNFFIGVMFGQIFNMGCVEV